MNHWKNIQERVEYLGEMAAIEASSSAVSKSGKSSAAAISDLAVLVRDLAAEVALMARLQAERQEAEQANLDYAAALLSEFFGTSNNRARAVLKAIGIRGKKG